jgi:hypothetical protein
MWKYLCLKFTNLMFACRVTQIGDDKIVGTSFISPDSARLRLIDTNRIWRPPLLRSGISGHLRDWDLVAIPKGG